ncbi:MAG: hypothetical protein ACLRSW_04235 [Christensenellaceae bacterium]
MFEILAADGVALKAGGSPFGRRSEKEGYKRYTVEVSSRAE